MRLGMHLGGIILAVALAGCSWQDRYPPEFGIKGALREGDRPVFEKAVVGPGDDGAYVVATTQIIDPAGEQVLFPGRPTDLALSPDGALLAVQNKNDLTLIRVPKAEVEQCLPLPKGGHSFCGVAWSRDGQRVWTTEAKGSVLCAARNPEGKFVWADTLPLPGPEGKGESAPGGFALDEDRGLLYVTLSRNNTLAVLELTSKKVVAEIPVGIAPYTVLRDGDRAYVSNWGGRRPGPDDFTGPSSGSRVVVDKETGIASTGTVTVVDLARRTAIAEIAVGLHPAGLAISPDRARVFVANANSDYISEIDTASLREVRTIGTKPMNELPFGSAPNALAISPDGNTLYAANGGNNAVAVIQLQLPKVWLKGFIPTGWYPGALALSQDGRTLFVANTKGVGSRYPETNVENKKKQYGPDWHGFNSHDHLGSISIIPLHDRPDGLKLAKYTKRVALNMRLPLMDETIHMEAVAPRTVPLPTRPGETSHFKHVLYIIKENRTYDQVFGDMPQGNGDPSLCMFGRDVSPNHHALAEEFVLLDNFYCNGVLSADGHQWTDEGYVTDYIEKSFGGFSRSYPYDGDDAIAYASSGFIWDYVLRKGLSFRTYGEFMGTKVTPPEQSWQGLYADYLNGGATIEVKAVPQLHTLEPFHCPTFAGFTGSVPDVHRAREFLREWKQFEEKESWPNFTIMLLPNDHTVGTREGMPTPRAAVADNDYALGQIVEAVTHSKAWPETCIMVVEDDPQAGLDHVDGRRTVALCVSPYTKRGVVDSTHYNQTSMLRTMELMLGLPPMNQFDMAANPMSGCFMEEPNLKPYTLRPNLVPLDEMNPKLATLKGKQRYWAKKSHELPLDDLDKADENTFNHILWHAVKGYDTPYPQLARREAQSAVANRR